MKQKINLAMIGVGERGKGLLAPLLMMDDVQVTAVCDVYADRTEAAAEMVRKKKGNLPFQTQDYHQVLERKDVDAVLIATSWQYHIEIAIAAMEKGIFTSMEVGGTYDLSACHALVNAYERTKTPFFFLENCCYGQREMMCLNMARQGTFGEIVHCDGAYKHDLRKEISFGRENRHYRLEHYMHHNCENYPTHELGPIAKILDINRGNRMVSLVSVASKARGLSQYVRDNKPEDQALLNTSFQQGDIVTTIITCEKGETITLTLDTTLPRIYSRNFTIHGTQGMYQEDGDYVFLEKTMKKRIGLLDMHPERLWKNARKFAKRFDSDLWRRPSRGMKKSSHGGMDYLVLRAMLHAAKGETIPAIDVYDAAAWMSITALSALSVANNGAPQEIPDFTSGGYQNRIEKATGKYALD